LVVFGGRCSLFGWFLGSMHTNTHINIHNTHLCDSRRRRGLQLFEPQKEGVEMPQELGDPDELDVCLG
jgi:hypothetical protein